jgi:hypothetical protein
MLQFRLWVLVTLRGGSASITGIFMRNFGGIRENGTWSLREFGPSPADHHFTVYINSPVNVAMVGERTSILNWGLTSNLALGRTNRHCHQIEALVFRPVTTPSCVFLSLVLTGLKSRIHLGKVIIQMLYHLIYLRHLNILSFWLFGPEPSVFPSAVKKLKI